MSGVTVSAHTSQEIVSRLDAIAKAERRNRSQVVSMALDLFVELPPSAREAWLKLSNTNSQQQMKVVMDKIARTIIDAQYQTAHAQLIAEMQIEHLEPLETEDDILTAAVNMTNRK
jgi:predicted transcriptional regulator